MTAVDKVVRVVEALGLSVLLLAQPALAQEVPVQAAVEAELNAAAMPVVNAQQPFNVEQWVANQSSALRTDALAQMLAAVLVNLAGLGSTSELMSQSPLLTAALPKAENWLAMYRYRKSVDADTGLTIDGYQLIAEFDEAAVRRLADEAGLSLKPSGPAPSLSLGNQALRHPSAAQATSTPQPAEPPAAPSQLAVEPVSDSALLLLTVSYGSQQFIVSASPESALAMALESEVRRTAELLNMSLQLPLMDIEDQRSISDIAIQLGLAEQLQPVLQRYQVKRLLMARMDIEASQTADLSTGLDHLQVSSYWQSDEPGVAARSIRDSMQAVLREGLAMAVSTPPQPASMAGTAAVEVPAAASDHIPDGSLVVANPLQTRPTAAIIENGITTIYVAGASGFAAVRQAEQALAAVPGAQSLRLVATHLLQDVGSVLHFEMALPGGVAEQRGLIDAQERLLALAPVSAELLPPGLWFEWQ